MLKKDNPQQIDPQRVIVDMCLKRHLLTLPEMSMTITHEEMLALSKFTLRLEVVDTQHPQTSPIKCSLITIDEAEKMMKELQRSRKP